MGNVSTRPQQGATPVTAAVTPVTAPQQQPRLIGANDSKPAIEFDSTAIDILIARTEEIQALASCSMCLAATERATGDFNGHELTDDALPLLADVIKRLASEAGAASERLWEQYQQALAAANGTEHSA